MTVSLCSYLPRHRHLRLLSLVAVLAIVVSACSSPGVAKTATIPPPSAKTLLLTLHQMSGWSAAPHNEGVSPCYFNRTLTRSALSMSENTFSNSSVTSFSELVTVEPTRLGKSVYATAVRQLDACHRFNMGASQVGPMTGKPYPFPQLGNGSAAFAFTVLVSVVSIDQYVVVARFGSVVTAFMQIGGSRGAFEGLVKKASARIWARVRS